MSASQTIAPYLPFLRRYARALTGNQTSGDAYVAAALEALIEDTCGARRPASPRVALYRLFTQDLEFGGGERRRRRRSTTNLPAEQRLSQITPQTPPGLPSGRARRLFGSTMPPQVLECDIADVAAIGRGIRSRACRRDRDRRDDHRGRALHRDGSRGSGREPRPSRARRRAHAYGSDRRWPRPSARA